MKFWKKILSIYFLVKTALMLGNLKKLIKDTEGAVAKTIIMFLVVVVIFAALFGTIAYQLENLSENDSVAAIPGGVAVLGIVSLMGIIIILMYAIRKAF